MVEQLKKGDFVEIDFVGRVKGSGRIFDLTLEDVAKKEGLFQQDKKYKPLIVCLGAGHLIKGLDSAIQKHKVGDEFEIDIPSEEAFGNKNPSLIQLTSLKIFKEKGINPVPGLQVAVNGALAIVRSVSGGRVILDFNHPLAGKNLHYWVRINRKVIDAKEKVHALLELLAGKSAKIELSETELKIDLKLPTKLAETLKKQIKELIPEVAKLEIKFSS